MTRETDANPRITVPWTRIVDGLWIGEALRPFRGEFDYVLALTRRPPAQDDRLRVRHLVPPTDEASVPAFLMKAVDWCRARWRTKVNLLIQAEELQWADLVVIGLFVEMGATTDEAILSLRQARPSAVADARSLDLIRACEVRHDS